MYASIAKFNWNQLFMCCYCLKQRRKKSGAYYEHRSKELDLLNIPSRKSSRETSPVHVRQKIIAGQDPIDFWVMRDNEIEVSRIQPEGDQYFDEVDRSPLTGEATPSDKEMQVDSLRVLKAMSDHIDSSEDETSQGHGSPFRRLSPSHARGLVGAIQPELYVSDHSPPGRRPSIGQKDSVVDESYGTLWFSVRYDETSQKLIANLHRACDLPGKGQNEATYDTYVEICVLPNEKTSQKSKIVRRTCNPIYDEEFSFPFDSNKLVGLTLRMTVYDCNRQHKHNAVGSVLVPFGNYSFSDLVEKGIKGLGWKLERKAEPLHDLGQLYISLAYLPSGDRLSVVILRAKHLKKARELKEDKQSPESLDTYVKVTLVYGNEKVKTRKTQVIGRTDNPVYNESLAYVVPPGYLDDSSLVITVMQRGFIKRDAPIGRIILGPYWYCQGRTLSHWGQMLSRRQATKQWHYLYL
ncbi:synaptotagmin-15-like [Ptychodera flava]|uniref:synaptotagmin-15-like n=1 Tax=Ptychodera flava TaxID=63121 RepID=UPI003969C106